MSDYWQGVLSVFALTGAVIIGILGARLLAWSTLKLGHVFYVHGHPSRTNQQRRASMAAVHYGAHHGRTIVIGDLALTVFTGMNHDDREWAQEQLTKRIDIGLSDEFLERMKPAEPTTEPPQAVRGGRGEGARDA